MKTFSETLAISIRLWSSDQYKYLIESDRNSGVLTAEPCLIPAKGKAKANAKTNMTFAHNLE